MGIQGEVFTNGQWQRLTGDGFWDGTTRVEKVKFQLSSAPSGADIFYQAARWDGNRQEWIWTAAQHSGGEVGLFGDEIYGLHMMLSGFPGFTTWISIKTANGWGAAHNSIAESINPLLGFQILISKP